VPCETLAALRTEQLWDVFGVLLDGPKAEGKHVVLEWNFTDTSGTFRLWLWIASLALAMTDRHL
jgi:alkyl sulfatase BDS1-like metallo-beta-lactamase superfamily hydrolase